MSGRRIEACKQVDREPLLDDVDVVTVGGDFGGLLAGTSRHRPARVGVSSTGCADLVRAERVRRGLSVSAGGGERVVRVQRRAACFGAVDANLTVVDQAIYAGAEREARVKSSGLGFRLHPIPGRCDISTARRRLKRPPAICASVDVVPRRTTSTRVEDAVVRRYGQQFSDCFGIVFCVVGGGDRRFSSSAWTVRM
jgi:hypothetical protein